MISLNISIDRRFRYAHTTGFRCCFAEQSNHFRPEPITNTFLISLILGIISSALACVPILSTICSILGIIFVIKVRKREKVFHNGLVTAGLILCICGFVLSLLFLAYWIWYLFVFLCTVETQPHHEAPPPMPKYHGHPAKFLLSFYFQR